MDPKLLALIRYLQFDPKTYKKHLILDLYKPVHGKKDNRVGEKYSETKSDMPRKKIYIG